MPKLFTGVDQTVGEAIKAKMLRLKLKQVDAVQLSDYSRYLIITQDDPVLNEPLGSRTIRLLTTLSDAEGANGAIVRFDSPVGHEED